MSLSIFEMPYQADASLNFQQVRHLPFPVMLESGKGRYADMMGRYDIISADPQYIISDDQTQGHKLLEQVQSHLDKIKLNASDLDSGIADSQRDALLKALPFLGGAIGFLSYDFGKQLERLPNTTVNDISLPSAWFGIYGWVLISDHLEKKCWLINDQTLSSRLDSDLADIFEFATTQDHQAFQLTTPFTSNLSKAHYLKNFQTLKDYIGSGDCYQVNFAQRYSATFKGDSFGAYQKISTKIPTPFAAYFDLGKWQILSHSPERFISVKNDQVCTQPIKGTRPRGYDDASDKAMKKELVESTKDKAENLMIVDLLRNDLSKSCVPFSVKVPRLFDIESYPNVHHLVSTITGQLDPDFSATRLLGDAFPGGSITGAPKIRAMEIIDELEPHHRSIYCGSVIYLCRSGKVDSNITIRTLVCEDNNIYAWGGGGIVMDSDGEEEYQETLTKIGPLLNTLN